VVFTKDMKTLVKYTTDKYGSARYTVPAEATRIADGAFYDAGRLREISVAEGNDSYVSRDGVLFTKDMQTLVCYPQGKEALAYAIPAGVTRIGRHAFERYTNLMSITVPGSVTAIEAGAFNNLARLRKINAAEGGAGYASRDEVIFTKDMKTLVCYPPAKEGAVYEIPAGVTAIGDCAFENCANLTGVVIPGSVTSIGEDAFLRCECLADVVIPTGVTSIGANAFYECKNLVNFTIPPSVTSIGKDAFDWDWESAPDGVTRDGVLFSEDMRTLLEYPSDREGLAYAVPAGVTAIGDKAFYCCDLTDITLPDGLTSIGESAFDCCDLREIVIPGSVRSIGESAFYGCGDLARVVILDGVTAIGDEAFYCCESLTEITIPPSVTSIGASAFDWCNKLENITIPAGVTYIGESVFCGADGLREITVAAGNESYTVRDGLLFSKDMKTLLCYPPAAAASVCAVPAGVTRVAGSAFFGCDNLETVALPGGLTSIGEFAFKNCKNLKRVNIPDSVTDIGDSAFENCEDLRGIVIPGAVARIGLEAFDYCENMTEVAIAEGVAYIGGSAFSNCAIKKIVIPGSVKVIGGGAFDGCKDLESVVIADGVISIESAFRGCKNLREVNIPGSTIWIGPGVFEGAECLRTIAVAEGSADYAARDGVLFTKDMKTLLKYPPAKEDPAYEIPTGVTTVEDGAFHKCKKLAALIVPGSVTEIVRVREAFRDCECLRKISVAEGSAVYAAQDGVQVRDCRFSGIVESVLWPRAPCAAGA
jgi:hypothetical protein